MKSILCFTSEDKVALFIKRSPNPVTEDTVVHGGKTFRLTAEIGDGAGNTTHVYNEVSP